MSLNGVIVEYALWFAFFPSNNEVEYEAIITGLRLAKKLGVVKLKIFSDSQLVIRQVRRELVNNTDCGILVLGAIPPISNFILFYFFFCFFTLRVIAHKFVRSFF